MNYNPLLALVSGTGEGVDAVQQRNRQRRLDEQSDQDRRARQALQQVALMRDLREMGLRPATDTDVGAAADRTLAQMPVAVTPSRTTITMPAPQAAPLPGAKSSLRAIAEASGSAQGDSTSPPDSAGADRSTQAMRQLVVAQAFQKRPADAPEGPTLTAALHPQAITDAYGEQRHFVEDPSITPEARAMRELLARGRVDRENSIAVRDAEIRTQRDLQSMDRQRKIGGFVAAGYTPQEAAMAADNPAMADNVWLTKHPTQRVETAAEREAREALADERRQRQADYKARYIGNVADKYVQAANGDARLAAALASQAKDGLVAYTAGLGSADFYAAAQRYKDRFTAKSKATDDESDFIAQLRGGGESPRNHSAASPSTDDAPSSAGGRGASKPTITQDQADYIKTTRGWTDAQIAQRYTVAK